MKDIFKFIFPFFYIASAINYDHPDTASQVSTHTPKNAAATFSIAHLAGKYVDVFNEQQLFEITWNLNKCSDQCIKFINVYLYFSSNRGI